MDREKKRDDSELNKMMREVLRGPNEITFRTGRSGDTILVSPKTFHGLTDHLNPKYSFIS